MYYGNLEIESIENNVVTFKNGKTIEVTDKNKELFTEEQISGSDLQTRFAKAIAQDIIDVLAAHNARLTDLNLVMNIVNDIVTGKNEEAIVKVFGKEKLDTIAAAFGANEALASLSVRGLRIKDIF